MRFLSCCRVSVFVIVVGRGWESVRGVLRLRPDQVLTMDGCKRIDERLRGMFYHGPTVGAKCTCQNLEQTDARVDITKIGFMISHVGL